MTLTKKASTFAVTAMLPFLAAAAFMVLSPKKVEATFGPCVPGICEKNGCTEKSQQCNHDGSGWFDCGSC